MQPKQFIFEAIGTRWVIDVLTPVSTQTEQEVLIAIHERIEAFDKTYSRFRADSVITKMSQKAGEYIVPNDATPLLSLYKELYSLTDGAFTPLIGKTLEEAGYDASYSLASKKLHHPPRWEDVIIFLPPKLQIKKSIVLDIGACGKGYLVDLVSELLVSFGITSYCIDAGGDILYKTDSEKPIRVGLEHPENLKQVIGVAEILNQSICGSAGNRRKWGKYHHIIDPKTLQSPQHLLATWVIADTALIADALATCLYFVEPEKLQKFSFQYLMLYPDYSIKMSPDFPAEIYYNK
jgi:FAD:protein FMN transferase